MSEKVFDRISQGYKGELGQKSMEDVKKRINWICKNVIGDTILDVGCSQGITSVLLAKEGKNVIGIDSELSRIEYAEEDKKKEGLKDNPVFVCSDFLAYDFQSEFDTIIMGELLEHVFAPKLFLDKAKSLLKPDGRLIVTVPFGINPFSDHKRTYYFSELFNQINERIFVSDIAFIERWIGFIADISNKKTDVILDGSFIEKLENAFFAVDSSKQESIDKVLDWHKNSNQKVEIANKKINELENEIKNVLAQCEDEKAQITGLKERYEQIAKENEKALNDTRLALNEKTIKLDTIRSDYRNKDADFKDICAKYSDAQKHIYDLEYDNKIKNYEIVKYKEEIASAEERLEAVTDKLSSSREELRGVKEASDNRIAEMKQKLDESASALNDLKKKTDKMSDDFIKAQAGVNTRNKRIDSLSKENIRLQKTVSEYNSMLYHSKRLNAAYERFPSIKAYNWLRKKKRALKKPETQELAVQAAAQPAAKAAEAPEAQSAVKPAKPVSDKAASRPKQAQQSIKYAFSLSDFKMKAEDDADARKQFKLRSDCTSLKDMKAACIMDEFTYSCFAPECELMQLTPESWKEEMEAFAPDMLFVESAWLGKDNKWYGMIVKAMPTFRELIVYCRRENIPVIFWNKEDPGHNEGFMTAAGLCDFVFTTEIDCIAQYKKCLGHDRVYLSHFAAQPKVHNPIETFERKDEFCFAGAYYTNYPNRTRAFDNLAHYAMRTKGLDIYDRCYGDTKAVHRFPEFYKPFILGRLEPDEIDRAYKGYTYNINANSGTWTQTMFARRVFELLASNTVSVGNFSKGLRNLFGDLTIATDSVDEAAKLIDKYCSAPEDMHRYRLQGFRKASEEDLYEDRLDYMVEKVFGISLKKPLPAITVVGRAGNKQEFDKILKMAQNQRYKDVKTYIKPEFEVEGDEDNAIPADMTLEDFIKCRVTEGYIAYFDSRDYYDENYLLDMALILRYGDYDAVGKTTYYGADGQLIEVHPVYHEVPELSFRRAMVSASLAAESEIDGDAAISGGGYKMASADEFDYQEGADDKIQAISSELKVNKGIAYEELRNKAEKLSTDTGEAYSIDIKDIFKPGKYGEIQLTDSEDGLTVSSSLPEDKYQYIYDNKLIKYDVDNHEYSFTILDGDPAFDVMAALTCYDAGKAKKDVVYLSAGLSKKAIIPEDTAYFTIALRIKGSGETRIEAIKFIKSEIGYRDCFLSKSNVLVLTNIYPSYDDLYRNAFVHQRVIGYKAAGFDVDVMCFNNVNPKGYREFEGVDIVTGFTAELEDILSGGSIDTVCVHFLNEYMWEVLKKFKDKIRVIIWCHGSEIQPWWRREFNYASEEELNKAKIESDKRYKLWRDVFEHVDECNMKFVFVSDYFKDEVFQDYKIDLKKENYEIIHNYINTDLFDYAPKTPEQRKKILSIRPFGSNKYANDLSVECIKKLSETDFFRDLTFHIIGRGNLFEPLMSELKEFDNVIAENRFLRQDEIAELHKENGIFLVPTRMDSQGVSRDEAMSSGLVPVTNAVTAIPEFVDDGCGILAEGENYNEMAEGIERLYKNPDLFMKMSEEAARRVRKQSAFEHTIAKEIELIALGMEESENV